MHYVMINEQCFAVADDAIGSLRADVLDAVHHGGAFVSMRTGSPRDTQVLVTSHTPVKIQSADAPEEGPSEDSGPSVPSRGTDSGDADWWL